MQYTLEEILDLIAEAMGTIFFIGFFGQFLLGDLPFGASKMLTLMIGQVLGG